MLPVIEMEYCAMQTDVTVFGKQGHHNLACLTVRVIQHDKPGVSSGAIVNVKRDKKKICKVVLTGDLCANGYYKDLEATKILFAGRVLHSGDLAAWYPSGGIRYTIELKELSSAVSSTLRRAT